MVQGIGSESGSAVRDPSPEYDTNGINVGKLRKTQCIENFEESKLGPMSSQGVNGCASPVLSQVYHLPRDERRPHLGLDLDFLCTLCI